MFIYETRAYQILLRKRADCEKTLMRVTGRYMDTENEMVDVLYPLMPYGQRTWSW